MYCYEILLRMQYFSCGSDKYTEIKMCDLEPFSKIQSHILISSYTVPYILNLKEIAPAVPEIRVHKTCQIFFIFFFFFAPNNKRVRKLCSCPPISMKFGAQVALPKPYISTKFGMI